MKMIIAITLVSVLAAAHGSILPLGLGLDSYAVPNYAYNYAIKDITGGAQEKSETRLGGVTKEQDSVVVNHLGGKYGLGSGVSQQNTVIVRGPSVPSLASPAIAAAPLGIAAGPLGITGPLGIAAPLGVAGLGLAGTLGYGARVGVAGPLGVAGLGLAGPLGYGAPALGLNGLGLAGPLGLGGLGLKGGLW